MAYNYHIMANFSSNRDNKGTLKMYNSAGTLVFGPVPALGRGSNDPANGNDHTQWKKKNSDVPTGEYETSVIAANTPASSYGPYKRVWLNPALSGNAKIAEDAGRDEILIHGGDLTTDSSLTWYPLRPTYGCIRLENSNQKALIDAITNAGGGKGKITIANI
ncbi:L,D-transpeptidase [Paenibacillus sp. NPDC057934]|uniref:L,D-transpeptidase n=1 Tax=Paenibacillus sp. NPDC057934 TaxID=3346282 RepID=UPI0036DFA0F7